MKLCNLVQENLVQNCFLQLLVVILHPKSKTTMQQHQTPPNLPKINPRLTKEQLQDLRDRLPRGSMTALSVACKCSPSKITGVFKGRFVDIAVIVAAEKIAEEYAKQSQVMADLAASAVAKLQ